MAAFFKFKQCFQNSVLRTTFSSKRSAVSDSTNGVHATVNSKCNNEELGRVQELMTGNLLVYDDFINEKEELMLYEEVRPSLEKRSYQREHWDDVSHVNSTSEIFLRKEFCAPKTFVLTDSTLQSAPKPLIFIAFNIYFVTFGNCFEHLHL